MILIVKFYTQSKCYVIYCVVDPKSHNKELCYKGLHICIVPIGCYIINCVVGVQLYYNIP